MQCYATLLVLALATSVRGWLDPKYHLDNKPQMLDALEFAQPKCPSGLVLDIGANGGRETNQARAKGYEVVSVECLTPEYIKLADKWKDDPKITLLNGCASNSMTIQKFSEAAAGSSLHPEAVSSGTEKEAFRKNGQRIRNVMTFPMDPLVESRNELPVCVVKIGALACFLPLLIAQPSFGHRSLRLT